jgi:hypothetical protein
MCICVSVYVWIHVIINKSTMFTFLYNYVCVCVFVNKVVWIYPNAIIQTQDVSELLILDRSFAFG